MGKKIKRVHELATHKRNNVCFFFKCSPPSLITKVMEKKKTLILVINQHHASGEM